MLINCDDVGGSSKSDIFKIQSYINKIIFTEVGLACRIMHQCALFD